MGGGGEYEYLLKFLFFCLSLHLILKKTEKDKRQMKNIYGSQLERVQSHFQSMRVEYSMMKEMNDNLSSQFSQSKIKMVQLEREIRKETEAKEEKLNKKLEVYMADKITFVSLFLFLCGFSWFMFLPLFNIFLIMLRQHWQKRQIST